MSHSSNGVVLFILQSALIGFFLGGIYEVFRTVRVIAHMTGRRIFTDTVYFVCDILFFVCCAIVSAIFIFYANNGSVRGVALMGSLFGFVVYYNTLGRLMSFVIKLLIRAMYRLICLIWTYAILPVGHICIRLCDRIYTLRQTGRKIRKFKRKGC
ncbi:MAG: spore cortex biosynthesis protein YabQ [Clostridia bacterium]|nr:spore cortex biosynthesis protein YabQ [Clostridia bacterium]